MVFEYSFGVPCSGDESYKNADGWCSNFVQLFICIDKNIFFCSGAVISFYNHCLNPKYKLHELSSYNIKKNCSRLSD